MSENLNWINDKLHELIGMSEAHTVNYIMAMGNIYLTIAKNSKQPREIHEKLVEFDFPDNENVKSFSESLFDKFGVKNFKPKTSEYEKHEIELIKQQNYNDSFKLLKDNEPKKIEVHENIKKEEKLLNKKRESEDVLEDIMNINVIEDKELKHLMKEKDRMERDLLDKRIKEKDEKQKQKKILENPLTAKLTMTEDERILMAQQLRKMSRNAYLKMRTEQQLDLWRRTLEDEQKLFKDVQLTEDEKKLFDINKKIYDLATKRLQKEPEFDKYKMPDAYEEEDGKINFDKKYKVLYDRYKEHKKEETEEEAWEKSQKTKSTLKYGAQDQAIPSDKYTFVLENQVKFVKKDVLDGYLVEDTKGEAHHEAVQAELLKSAEEMKAEEIKSIREHLPIYKYKNELLQAVRDYQVLVIVGETGSGKTTQIPQYLHEIGYSKYGKIGVTQPRRVAAMSVAARVAYEMNVKLGNEIGYSIRFEDNTSDKTIVKYMTDGVLLREFLTEPDLKAYSVLIIDEAHERTLHTDVIFGLVKDIAKYRKDLKILISSATLDAEKFRDYFDDAPIFKIPGRRFPVDIFYTKQPEADYIEAAVITTLQIHVSQPKGDILVFLTGQEEIELAHEMLLTRTRGLGTKIGELIINDIYSALPSDLQAKIFEPTPDGARKVILATNIAETSLTIDGIVYVIDCGFCKQTSFNPKTGMESLVITPVSKASANQRAGRAGRVGPGKCFRLYTAWSFQHELDSDNIPEIQRTNLTSTVLMLKSLGINDLIHFDFIDPPPAENLIRALEQLYALGALNNDGDLTKLGRRMAEFPIDPCLAKAIISSQHYKCVDQVLTISSMLSVGNSIFYRPKEKQVHADNARNSFFRPGGDHFTLLTVFNIWKDCNYSSHWCYENYIQARSMRKARDIKEQLISLCDRVEIDYTDESLSINDDINIRKAITAGYFYNCAKLSKDGNYKTVKNMHTVHIHPNSSLFKETPKWVIYHELVFTTKEFMRDIIEIAPEWLMEVAPHYYKNIDLVDSTNAKKNIKNKGTSKMNI
jgi:pre-mRNA-splicing factor ATP-dependent RNA helicase DHX16